LTPDLRHDPRSGRWSAIAPGRRARPGAVSPSDGACPFCAGNEHLTPPETLRLGAGPTGWDVRVVPNLYPALERQEVVIHGPAHIESFGDLPNSTVAAVAEAWQRRARDVGGNCFAFVNEGEAAGASQHHSHSQLAWLPEARSAGELPPGVPVLERDGLLLTCPSAGRSPYELFIAPLERESSGLASELLAPALVLLAAAIRRLHERAGADLPLNAWLLDGTHWRIELLPRSTRFAGLELGANVYVTTLAPEHAAEALQGL
jgi:UDPglucose--hexose-1-phosphate uridylyltransferase